jgi:TrmH family RNA methyltransferase
VEVATEPVTHSEEFLGVGRADGDFYSGLQPGPEVGESEMHRIESRANDRLKDIRRLRRSKGSRDGRLLIEGPHLLEAALDAGLRLETVVATEEFLESGDPVLARLERPPLLAAARLLDELADADSPRGLVAVAAEPERSLSRIQAARGAVVVYLDGVQDPGNLGAVARVAEATRVAGLALGPGCVHPSHPRALRSSAGSLLRIATAVDVAAQALRAHLEGVGARWLALVPRGGRDPFEAELPETAVLMLGAEGPGLRPELAAAADERVTIPLAPPVESLNVAVSAAVLLFERQRQWRG